MDKRFSFNALVCVVGLCLLSSGASGQSGPKPLEFEVAAIHVNPLARGGWQPGNGTLSGTGTIASLVQLAYAIDSQDNIGLLAV